MDRKTVRRYVAAAQAEGLVRDAGVEALSDGLIGAVVAAVRPARPNGHGQAWDLLLTRQEQITAWVDGGEGQPALSIVKIEELLARQGCVVPCRTLHRFAVERCGFGGKSTTVRVNDGEPGMECQIDFAQMGIIVDPQTGKKRRVHALIFTAVVSRHMFVWVTYSQTLVAMIAGCEAAWDFFGGVFKVLIPDNLKAVVTKADAVNPRLSAGWLDYAQHAGFATDPARVRTPKDKPRVERAVQYVRGNFWAGESFTDLDQAQARVSLWCSQRAGMRIHGTTAARLPRCSTGSRPDACCRSRPPMTCRGSPGSRCTATSTSRSPGRCTRCPTSGSGSTSTPAPTPSWSSSMRVGSWSRPTPDSPLVGGRPTGATCPPRRPGTRCGTSPR